MFPRLDSLATPRQNVLATRRMFPPLDSLTIPRQNVLTSPRMFPPLDRMFPPRQEVSIPRHASVATPRQNENVLFDSPTPRQNIPPLDGCFHPSTECSHPSTDLPEFPSRRIIGCSHPSTDVCIFDRMFPPLDRLSRIPPLDGCLHLRQDVPTPRQPCYPQQNVSCPPLDRMLSSLSPYSHVV